MVEHTCATVALPSEEVNLDIFSTIQPSTSFCFVIYGSLEATLIPGGALGEGKSVERVLHFSRESGVDGNLCASLSFGTSATRAGMAAHFQSYLCII